MKKKRKRLSPAEVDLMQHLWRTASATVTELRTLVNADRGDAVSRNTIQVQLQRLEDKGWVTHTPDGRLFRYQPTVSAEQGMAELTRDFRNKVFGGSALALVRCLVDADDITQGEIDELRKLINQTEEK